MANTRMVRVFNRTSKPVEVMVDGIARIFQPGDHDDNFVEHYVALKAIERAPVAGTEDPADIYSTQSKLAVKKWGMDCSPIEDVPGALDRFDRSLLPEHRQRVIAVVPAGLQQRVDAEMGKGAGRGLRNMATPAVQGQGGENLGNVNFGIDRPGE